MFFKRFSLIFKSLLGTFFIKFNYSQITYFPSKIMIFLFNFCSIFSKNFAFFFLSNLYKKTRFKIFWFSQNFYLFYAIFLLISGKFYIYFYINNIFSLFLKNFFILIIILSIYKLFF